MKKISREECYQTALVNLWNHVNALQTELDRLERVGSEGVVEADDVKWIVNNYAELGVEVYGKQFFLYKGYSLVYWDAETHDGTPMRYREVLKREFGECQHPEGVNPSGASDYTVGDGWKDIPKRKRPAPKTRERTREEKIALIIEKNGDNGMLWEYDDKTLDYICQALNISLTVTEE